MSYCRFGPHSDVYVFSDGETWACVNCRLGGQDSFTSLAELKRHLETHTAAGHIVPLMAMARIEYEMNTGRDLLSGEEIPT